MINRLSQLINGFPELDVRRTIFMPLDIFLTGEEINWVALWCSCFILPLRIPIRSQGIDDTIPEL